MLPIRLEIPDEFFKEETRRGYTITREIKELWAVILDLLNELLTVCEKNEIKVFAGHGTLIGAVRENGFIPWDDDLDLLMMREDYEKFCRIAQFSPPYFLQTEFTDIGFTRTFARLRNSETTAIQKFERNMNIKYNQGVFIDIFPLDYLPDDRVERVAFGEKIRKLRKKALRWSLFSFRSKIPNRDEHNLNDQLKYTISKIMIPVLTALGISNPYTRKISSIATKHEKTETIGDYWFYNPEIDMDQWNKELFAERMMHPFETASIPIPSGYKEILDAEFPGWEVPKMEKNVHGELDFDCHIPYRKYLKRNN